MFKIPLYILQLLKVRGLDIALTFWVTLNPLIDCNVLYRTRFVMIKHVFASNAFRCAAVGQ